MNDAYSQFLAWERTSSDNLLVKKTYVKIAGDLVAGVLLSQLVYWNMPDKYGNTKLRVTKDGELWLAKKREDWWDECCITPTQFDRASKQLEELGLIEKKIFKFDGVPTVHIRVNFDKLLEEVTRLQEEAEKEIQERKAELTKPTPILRKDENGFSGPILRKDEDGFSGNMKMDFKEMGKSITDTTTEITTENKEDICASDLAELFKPKVKKQEKKKEVIPLSAVEKDRFEEFWRLYPKKKAKLDCMRAWKSLNPDAQLFKEIMTGLKRAINSKEWKEQDGKFIPYPATWLRKGRWLDEYEEAEEEVDRWKVWEERSQRELQNMLKGAEK